MESPSRIGVGLVTTPVTAAALADAADHEVGIAAGLPTTSRMVGLTLEIALMSAIVAARGPGGFATAPASPGALADGLALEYRVNAGMALATAGLAAAALPGSKPGETGGPGGRAVLATVPPDR